MLAQIRRKLELKVPPSERMKWKLRLRGIPVERAEVDIDAFQDYLLRSDYGRFPGYYGGGLHPNFREKALEHFMAAHLLGLREGDIYIDIASCDSPVARIYSELFGCRTFRQDLAYPKGVQGDVIGGRAEAMPIPDGFANQLALHCSFEHFEGAADMDFLREASRVLRPGGRLCILPLYLADRFQNLTDPAMERECLVFDDGAEVVLWPSGGVRFSRIYDAGRLESRVLKQLGDLKSKIIQITNAHQVDPACYLNFALLIEKPKPVPSASRGY